MNATPYNGSSREKLLIAIATSALIIFACYQFLLKPVLQQTADEGRYLTTLGKLTSSSNTQPEKGSSKELKRLENIYKKFAAAGIASEELTMKIESVAKSSKVKVTKLQVTEAAVATINSSRLLHIETISSYKSATSFLKNIILLPYPASLISAKFMANIKNGRQVKATFKFRVY